MSLIIYLLDSKCVTPDPMLLSSKQHKNQTPRDPKKNSALQFSVQRSIIGGLIVLSRLLVV